MTRTLPQAPEAEQELVAAAWVDGAIIDDVRELVTPGDFFFLAHEHLWEAMLACYDEHGRVDFPIVREALRRRGTPAFDQLLASSMERGGTTKMVETYARRVRDASRLRALVEACDGISHQACTEMPDDVEGFVCRAEDSVRRAAEQGSSDTYEPASAVTGFFERLADRKQGRSTEEAVGSIDIGWPHLKRITNGLPRGIVVVMERPGMGKTAWCLSVALGVATSGGRVFVSSLELDSDELWGRLVSLISGVPYVVLDNRTDLSPEDWERVSHAAAKISELQLAIDCEEGLTASQIAVRGARAKRKLGGLDIHVVDYFHIMEHPQAIRSERLDTAMGRSSKSLMNYSKRSHVCLLLAAQVNRACADRDDKRPVLRDLRECGSLEQDAKMVLVPHRPWVYDKSVSPTEAQLVMRKNRGGPTDVIAMHFEPGPMRFREDANRVLADVHPARAMGMKHG